MPSLRKTSLTLSAISRGTAFRTSQERIEALSLIRRLALSSGVASAESALEAATLEVLTGGRSTAHVYKLTLLGNPRGKAQRSPVVMKIAPRGRGAMEKANYEKFVRWALPAACRPDLLGFSRTRAFAGLCYSFLGRPDAHKIDTLTDCLQRGEAAKIGLVMRRIFDTMRDTWYSPAQCRAEFDIARRYVDRYFVGRGSTAQTEAQLRACAKRYFKARLKNGRYIIGGQSFPSPRALLFASDRKRPYRSCILHGDLNSDNIVFVDGSSGVSVIDFEKTGRGHVHEDLIAVEASIRINYVRDASFEEILDKERRIALGTRRFSQDPYSSSIRKVRDTASRYFARIESDDNYQFGVAAIGLRLMQAVDLSHVARARITASALWAAKALAHEI